MSTKRIKRFPRPEFSSLGRLYEQWASLAMEALFEKPRGVSLRKYLQMSGLKARMLSRMAEVSAIKAAICSVWNLTTVSSSTNASATAFGFAIGDRLRLWGLMIGGILDLCNQLHNRPERGQSSSLQAEVVC